MEWNMPKKTKAIIPVEAIVNKIVILRGERVILRRMLSTHTELARKLKELEEMRNKPLKFKKLDDFLKEYQPGV
jgi:hypothetical protein